MHQLDGSRLKLSWAEKHLNSLKAAIDDFIRKKSYTFELEADPKPPKFVIIARMNETISSNELGLIIGDFAHNARSALDQLVYQLSKLPPDDIDARRHLQFPICDTEERYRQAIKRGYLGGVSLENVTIIEGLQLYQGVQGFDEDALKHLRDINDADKHRIIHIVGTIASFKSLSFSGPGQIGSSVRIGSGASIRIGHGGSIRVGNSFSYISVGDGVITKDRTVVARITAETPTQVNMHPDAQILIKFDEGSARVKGRPVVDTLIFIFNRVKEVIGKFDSVLST